MYEVRLWRRASWTVGERLQCTVGAVWCSLQDSEPQASHRGRNRNNLAIPVAAVAHSYTALKGSCHLRSYKQTEVTSSVMLFQWCIVFCSPAGRRPRLDRTQTACRPRAAAGLVVHTHLTCPHHAWRWLHHARRHQLLLLETEGSLVRTHSSPQNVLRLLDTGQMGNHCH